MGPLDHFQRHLSTTSMLKGKAKEALKLHPKLAVHNPIKLVDVKTEIQKGFYKQRLNMKSEEEREELGENQEDAEEREMREHALVEKDTNIINFNNLRPTDLTNRAAGVPPLANNNFEMMAAIEAESTLRRNVIRKASQKNPS